MNKEIVTVEKTKWFLIEKTKNNMYYLISKKQAKTKEEAWEKTFEKWELIKKYAEKDIMFTMNPELTCGLCDVYGHDCFKCPVVMIGGSLNGCRETPHSMWSFDRLNLDLINREIRFLEDIYKKEREVKKNENR